MIELREVSKFLIFSNALSARRPLQILKIEEEREGLIEVSSLQLASISLRGKV